MKKTQDKNLPIIKNGRVEFYRPYMKNGIFSNFYNSPVKIDGKIWQTTEHYFQAQKFNGTEKEETIRKLKTPNLAFKIGRQRDTKFPIREDWEKCKDHVMKIFCCKAKFTQIKELKQFLLDTGDNKIVESSPRDSYWGTGKSGKGKNKLGQILMEIRQELLDQSQDQELNKK